MTVLKQRYLEIKREETEGRDSKPKKVKDI